MIALKIDRDRTASGPRASMTLRRRPELPPGMLVVALVLLVLIGWGLGELARATAQQVDLGAVRDLAADRTGALTTASRALSLIGSGYVVLALTLVVAGALFTARRRGAGLAVGLSTLGAIVISNADKLLVGRPRPPVHHLQDVTSSSFPSGHASQSTALFLVLALVFIAARPSLVRAVAAGAAAVLLIFAVAFSRIYLGVHYPTDVAGGILLSAAWTGAVAGTLLPVTAGGSKRRRRRVPQP